MSSPPPDVPAEVPKSPKHLSFVIDFGERKFDTQRHKALVKKLQNRHKRGQSLTQLDDLPPPTSTSKRPPSSGSLPRKNSFQSEGYSSCDERTDHIKNSSTTNKNVQYSRLRADLKLPLKNINSDKMTQSFPNGSFTLSSIKSPDLELQDVSSPELDLISPFTPSSLKLISPLVKEERFLSAWTSPECRTLDETVILPDTNSNKFVDGTEYDFDKSDTASEAGTYTLDTDNYTEEQKARMSIDRDFNIEHVSCKQRTEEYVQSLLKKDKAQKTIYMEPQKSKHILNESFKESQPNSLTLFGKSSQEHKIKVVSPILSPTQNVSFPDRIISDGNKKSQNIKEPGSDRNSDKGCFTSITTSGAFGRKCNTEDNVRPNSGLTKSRVETLMYIDPLCKTNNAVCNKDVQRLEDTNKSDELNSGELATRLCTLPPAVGGSSGKNSPTKIPSPQNSAFVRPRSRNSVTIDSDSSLETESFLKPTQHYINSLQKRLSLDSNPEGDFQKNHIKLNNELQKMAHIRHNSFDDKNLQGSNKLEHFQNKSLQVIDQTYINKFDQSVHKVHNSPNRSPVQRSISMSASKNQVGYVQRKITNLTVSLATKNNNIRNSPKLDQNNSIQSQQSTMKASLLRMNSPGLPTEQPRIIAQFGDTESSSEEDYERNSLRKKDLSNLTSTRYNRAFALRRARLDEPPVPKCPNTPEMRRKFQVTDHMQSERALSVDRRPTKTSSVSSRYLQNPLKVKTLEKPETPKNVPKCPTEKSQTVSRTDSGRLSMRLSKANLLNKPKNALRDTTAKKPKPSTPGGRSNSSLSSREVEFQNWKRRKSYDPMKAAAEGKKKLELAKKQCQNMTQSYNEHQQNQDCDSSPSHSSSVHRSQSFHGTAALAHLISSEEEDDFTLSADEGFSPPAPSPYKLSPVKAIPGQAWRGKLLN